MEKFIYKSIIDVYGGRAQSLIREKLLRHNMTDDNIRESVVGDNGYFYNTWLVIHETLTKLKNMDENFKKEIIGRSSEISKNVTKLKNMDYKNLDITEKSVNIKRDMDESICIMSLLLNLAHINNYLTVGSIDQLIVEVGKGNLGGVSNMLVTYANDFTHEEHDIRYTVSELVVPYLETLPLPKTPHVHRGDKFSEVIQDYSNEPRDINGEDLIKYREGVEVFMELLPLGAHDNVDLSKFVNHTYNKVIDNMLIESVKIMAELKHESSDLLNSISSVDDLKKFKQFTDTLLKMLYLISGELLVSQTLFANEGSKIIKDVIDVLNKVV